MRVDMAKMGQGQCICLTSDDVSLVCDCGSGACAEASRRHARNAREAVATSAGASRRSAAVLSGFAPGRYNCFADVFPIGQGVRMPETLYVPDVGFDARRPWHDPARVDLANLCLAIHDALMLGDCDRYAGWVDFLAWACEYAGLEGGRVVAVARGDVLTVGDMKVEVHSPERKRDGGGDAEGLLDLLAGLVTPPGGLQAELSSLLGEVRRGLLSLVAYADPRQGAAGAGAGLFMIGDDLSLRGLAQSYDRLVRFVVQASSRMPADATQCALLLDALARARLALDARSLVCTASTGGGSVLLTGDMPGGGLAKICEEDLRGRHFSAIVAPHYGIASHRGGYIRHVRFSHLLLSNGEAGWNRGPISARYLWDARMVGAHVLCACDSVSQCEALASAKTATARCLPCSRNRLRERSRWGVASLPLAE